MLPGVRTPSCSDYPRYLKLSLTIQLHNKNNLNRSNSNQQYLWSLGMGTRRMPGLVVKQSFRKTPPDRAEFQILIVLLMLLNNVLLHRNRMNTLDPGPPPALPGLRVLWLSVPIRTRP